MEIVIVICLLIIIVLLLQDKIVIHKSSTKELRPQKVNPNLPDIMGQPKPVERLSVLNTATERQIQQLEINPANLDIAYDENENIGIQIPQEELDEVFSKRADLEEEEEEWTRYGLSGGDDGFASGVTFDELTTVGMLLEKEILQPELKQKAVDIVLKIQGTELFSLLESNMDGASQKIAKLLDETLSLNSGAGASSLHNELDDFDIGEFV